VITNHIFFIIYLISIRYIISIICPKTMIIALTTKLRINAKEIREVAKTPDALDAVQILLLKKERNAEMEKMAKTAKTG